MLNIVDEEPTRAGFLGFSDRSDPAFHLSFVKTLYDTGIEAMVGWLASNDVPPDVGQVLDGLYALFLYASEMAENGKVMRGTNVMLEEQIAPLTRGIVAIGGTFYGPHKGIG